MPAKHGNRIVGKNKNILCHLHGKNDFTKVSKNLVGYRFENSFVKLSK